MTASGGDFADVASAINTVKVKGSESDGEVDAKLYLLNTTEASNVPENVRKFSTSWWLRSPGDSDMKAAFVDGGSGVVYAFGYGFYYVYGVRPALKLNLSSVIFDSESKEFSLKSSHTHSFTYAASGATITATCGNTGCTLTAIPTLTIVKPTLETYGQTGKSAVATLDGLDAFKAATSLNVAETDIKYVGRGGTSYAESGTAPTDAGKYTAKITLSGVKTSAGDNQSVTASVDYEIAKAATSVTTPPAASEITYGKTLAESCVIGTRLAASVIATKENVCPRFRPEEFDLDPARIEHLMTV
jgi:hypothetical protein